SLGAALYAAIEGQAPYGYDEDSDVIVHRAAMAQIIMPTRCGVLTRVLLHMLEPDPNRRPIMAQAREEILTAAFGRGTGGYIIGSPVRTEDGAIPSWVARAADGRTPHFAALPRPVAPQQPTVGGKGLQKPLPQNAPLAAALGLAIGAVIISVILLIVL
ncbi:MAG: serine/threonine protein kinase, partial [Mycobacterium sp.]|nr:serine/threonine protein kinase [Mycobacterium sp.]